MKIATRSLLLREGDDLLAEIGRSFIEAYIHASRMMFMPQLAGVEKRQMGMDMQFILEFQSSPVTLQIANEAIVYHLSVRE